MKLRSVLIVLFSMVLLYLFGPKAESFDLDHQALRTPASAMEAMEQIDSRESAAEHLRPQARAKIIWADSMQQKTHWVLLYLPGFTATHFEGDPIHKAIADRYGMNLYLPRMAEHGLDEDEPMLNLRPDTYLLSAYQAIAEARALGDSILLMSCSTGGTLSLIAAAEQKDNIHGLLLYSPNIDMYDQRSRLLTKPWGLQIARLATGGKYRNYECDEEHRSHWTVPYRLEAAVAVRQLLDESMNEETFSKVKQPVYLAYYHADEEHEDKVVSVPAMQEMFTQLGTEGSLKREKAFADAGSHMMLSSKFNPNWQQVFQGSCSFLEEVLGLKPSAHQILLE